jgi:hypothetical protein
MLQHVVARSSIWFAAFVVATLLQGSTAGADESQILRGFEIAPVKLNLARKDWALVGLGSYIVNTTGCNDCHTHPNWATGGNPYLGQPEQINTAEYLAGASLGQAPGHPLLLLRTSLRTRTTGQRD